MFETLEKLQSIKTRNATSIYITIKLKINISWKHSMQLKEAGKWNTNVQVNKDNSSMNH